MYESGCIKVDIMNQDNYEQRLQWLYYVDDLRQLTDMFICQQSERNKRNTSAENKERNIKNIFENLKRKRLQLLFQEMSVFLSFIFIFFSISEKNNEE